MYVVVYCTMYNVHCLWYTLCIQYNIHPLYFCTVVILSSMKRLPFVKYVCLVTSVQSPIVFILCTVGTRWDASLVFSILCFSPYMHVFCMLCACLSVRELVCLYVRMSVVVHVSTFDSKQAAAPSACLFTYELPACGL